VETAVSGLISEALSRRLDGHAAPAGPPAAPADWRDEWFVFMVPDVSDEAAAAITKAKAWPAFNAFFRLLWKRQREHQKKGRLEAEAACQAGILLGEGVRGLARSIGLDPKAMNRQLAALHRLGILAVGKPPAALVRDEKGRIIRRPTHKGLVPASKVRFNAGDEHRRPANRQGANRPLKAEAGGVSQGANRPLKGKRPKGRSATTPISPFPISPSAGGHAGGTGRPAEENRRLPAAGGAGGHAAARASQDEGPACRPWTGSAAEAYRFMRERLEAEKADRDAKDAADAARLAEMKRQAAAAPPPPTATDAAAALTDAVAQLPAASRKKAKKVGKKMSKADRQADAEESRLRQLIEEKRKATDAVDPAKAKALKAAATEAWKTKRARPAAAAQEANV
jgi:hypothetical protein